MKFYEIPYDYDHNTLKILFSGYCALFVSLLFLQYQIYLMTKDSDYIPIKHIYPLYQAHCSDQE